MVWQASNWARPRKTGSCARKSVFMCLAEACDPWGFAYVAAPDAAGEAELSERHFYRITKELADIGYITTFQARGVDGRLHNLYRLNFYPPGPAKGAPLPEGHPSANPKYKYKRGVENLHEAVARLSAKPGDTVSGGPGDTMSGGQVTNDAEPHDTMSGGSGEPGDKRSGAIGQMKQNQVTPESPTYESNDKNLETRARDADRPDGSASPAAAEEKPTPVNALWKENMAALEAAAGDAAEFRATVRDAIPHQDDGKIFVLAVPNRGVGNRIFDRYQRILEAVLDRHVAYQVTKFAFAQQAKRRARDKEKASS